MARRKARVEFLLSVVELLFLSLTVEALQGKGVKTRCYQEGVGQFERRFQGEGPRGALGNIFLVSTKLYTFCYRAVVLIQYRRVTDGQTDRQTDGQTDGIAVASTALAMRRAEKNSPVSLK